MRPTSRHKELQTAFSAFRSIGRHDRFSSVRQVARWHGGEAIITESPLGGARVTIAW